jgi:hypothetical protein
LSADSGIPIIGCASHRLNLAITEYLKTYEDLIFKVDMLMKKLQTVKYAARLNSRTHLKAVRKNTTRWSSVYSMVERYLKIKDFLPIEYPEIADLVATAREHLILVTLFNNTLKELEAATLLLQNEQSISLADTRAVFDSLMSLEDLKRCEFGKNHISSNSRIVHDPNFESGIVKVCNGQQTNLTNMEKNAISG